jgi:Cu2+-exporting ATPase
MTHAAESLAPPAPAPSSRASVMLEASCAHCGLPVERPEPAGASSLQFCCSACSVAYDIIHGAGLGAYYARRPAPDAQTRAVRPSGKSYAEYDEPAFAARHVTLAADGAKLELFLSGIHCTACVWLVERLPRVISGVKQARFELGRSALDVTYDPAVTRPSDIARALDGLGYSPHPSAAARREGQKERERALWVRLGVAGALAGNVMLMALALYSGAEADPAYAALFRWGSFLLTVPSVFFCGSVFLRGALASLRTRTPHMDLPISIGILAGFARSTWNTIAARGEVYFDSLAVLIFLLLVGRWLQARHRHGASQTLELIAALAPATARLVEGAATREVPADAVPVGAVVEVLADQRIPVDGVVLEGRSNVDTAWLTGESLPEPVQPGARVYAGTVNATAMIRIRVEVCGSETRLGRLMQSVESAQARRAPIVRLADRVAGYFVLAALGLSALTYVLWSFIDPTRAVDHAVALLVVTCPCALGMATPLAVSAALKRAARAGIFFKGGEFLEALARPGSIAFDKTGTLTEGRLALAAFVGDEAILPLVRAAEERSAHPIGRAIVASLPASTLRDPVDAEELPGAGVVARVGARALCIGSAALVRDGSAPTGATWERTLAEQAALGRPAVAVALDGEVKGVLAFSDPLRSDARASLDALRSAGYRVAVLSGDQPQVVDALAPALGPLLAARGGMRPEDKLAWVERTRQDGPVVMVGDGVNDAAAMAAADVAIAVHGGAEAALVAADVFTTLPGVGKVLEAVVGARRTLHVIRRGIAFSLAYNVLGVVLCMAGLISPLMAAILMPLSSLTVVTSALRARTFDEPSLEESR